MKMTTVFLILCFASVMGAEAQQTAPDCAKDLRGTTRSDGMPESVLNDSSALARTLTDFRNAATNFFHFDSTGRAVRDLLSGFSPGFDSASLPMCNEVGQCVTATIRPIFGGAVGIGIPGTPVTIGGPMVTTGYLIGVRDMGMNAISYETGTGLRTVARIPASGPQGLIYQDKTCRFNNHLEQAPESGIGGGGSGDESDNGGGSVGGDGQQGFPGATPIGGGSRSIGGNCWEFTARTKTGRYIGSYILCY